MRQHPPALYLLGDTAMIFIDNKYTRWYFNIITKAKSRNFSSRAAAKKTLGYVEKHHIIPRSLNGNDDVLNLVFLTAREHFVCHRLLTKMVQGHDIYKMKKGLERMLVSNSKQNRYRVTSKLFEQIRLEAYVSHSKLLKGSQLGENNPFYGKSHSNESKLKISQSNKGKRRRLNLSDDERKLRSEKQKGVPKSDSHKLAIKQSWINTKESRVGEHHPMYGKSHSAIAKQKMRESSAHRWTPEARLAHSLKCKLRIITKTQCPYCFKMIDPGNYKQHHGDKSKMKP